MLADTYRQRKQTGNCVRCNVVLAEEHPTLTCSKCHQRQLASWRAWRLRRIAEGGCLSCPAQAAEGVRHCATCMEERRAYLVAKRKATKRVSDKRRALVAN